MIKEPKLTSHFIRIYIINVLVVKISGGKIQETHDACPAAVNTCPFLVENKWNHFLQVAGQPSPNRSQSDSDRFMVVVLPDN